jgi:uncharacterized protein (DUF433 family)
MSAAEVGVQGADRIGRYEKPGTLKGSAFDDMCCFGEAERKTAQCSMFPNIGSFVILPFMKLDELKEIVHSDPDIMGGTPVFVGTRVPLQNLIDYLEGGESVEDFLDAFPTVKREQAIAVIEAGKLAILRTV